MAFGSMSFLFGFLPLTLLCYFLMPRRWRSGRNLVLLLFSLAFYCWGGVRLLPAFAVSCVGNWAAALLSAPGRRHRKAVYAAAVVFNVLMLGYYKYTGFLLGNLAALGIQDAHPIDLVITDICMPDMDGLELIQQMQKKNNQIQFIVLSGYAEFSYAETAIRLGVKAYLLKPVSNDDLKEAFDKVYKEMEQTASIRQEVQMKKRMDREQSAYQQEKALNGLFAEQDLGVINREKLCRICGCEKDRWGSEQVFYLAVLHINKESFEHERFRPVDHELVRFTIRNIFDEIDTSCEKQMVNSLSDPKQLYAIFTLDDPKKLRMEVERIFLRMRSVLEKKMDIYMTTGVSRPCSQVHTKTATEARIALKQRIIYGNGNIYFYEDIRILGEQEFPVSQLHLLEQYMEHNEIFKVKNLVQEIFSEELVKKYGSGYLRIMWIRILNILLHHYDRRGRNAGEVEKLLQSYNLPDQIQSIQEIRQKIVEMVMECVSTESVTDANARSKIQMAVGYIQEHFGENLTVNDLAEHYEMSPNYFSSMFKKEMSRSAVNYITELRINQARELLYHSELSVVDISKKVGYEDSQYFFRVFKKYLGMTPLQYREESRK